MLRSGSLITLLLLACAAILIDGCDKQRVFEENLEFKNRSWIVTDEPVFEFAVLDSAETYSLYYNVRNSLDYPYARIFVTGTIYDSTGREMVRKMVYNDLFDEKSGKPFGESGLGDLYDHQFPLWTQFNFPNRGKYSVKLTQFMRQDTLQGILAVGVRVARRSTTDEK